MLKDIKEIVPELGDERMDLVEINQPKISNTIKTKDNRYLEPGLKHGKKSP